MGCDDGPLPKTFAADTVIFSGIEWLQGDDKTSYT